MIPLETIQGFFPEHLRGPQFAKHLLKEYVECLSLEWISRSPWASKLLFIGGTCLRLVKGIERFSEDLDFDCKGMNPEDFKKMTDGLVAYLRSYGLPATAKDKESEKLSALRRSIVFPGLLKDMGLSPFTEERFLMKVEMQDQGVDYPRESATMARCGFLFPISIPPESVLCAMKLSALLSRGKGRDFFDTLFLLQRTEPDYAFLKQKTGIADKASLQEALRSRLSELSLMDKKRDVEHLLFHRKQAERILCFEEILKP